MTTEEKVQKYKNEECTYTPRSNQPCDICPHKITCLYMCQFLQEGLHNGDNN